ncbi:hypothetical protein ACE3MZ_23540 [Paenibacillus sp. WLX1005]|uniref:hypothetical protein n=1 Tax=unclassified Paenibacillus TaxID=185978 RepID=UPI003983FDAC
MKLFEKLQKKVTVNDYTFHCVINQKPSIPMVSVKVYSSKTSYVEFLFSWRRMHDVNPNRPLVCARLIQYAIDQGWDYHKEKQVKIIEQGDDIIDLLKLEELDDM